jgi:hypothetical protein
MIQRAKLMDPSLVYAKEGAAVIIEFHMVVTGAVRGQKVTVHVEIGEEVAQVEVVGALDTDIEVLVTKTVHARVIRVQNMEQHHVRHGMHRRASLIIKMQHLTVKHMQTEPVF